MNNRFSFFRFNLPALIVAAPMLIMAQSAGAVVITFDDLGLVPNNIEHVETSPVSIGHGYTMQRSSTAAGTTGLIIFADPAGSNSFNSGGNLGYRYLTAHNSGQDLFHTLSRSDGNSFTLNSLDFHGWNNNAAPTLIVDGILAGGGTVSQSFAINNTSTQPFETGILSSVFTNLSSVIFRSPTGPVGVFQIDNIDAVEEAILPVTEPGTLVLFGLALAGVGFVRRRRAVA